MPLCTSLPATARATRAKSVDDSAEVETRSKGEHEEARAKQLDDILLKMRDIKNDFVHVREPLGVVVRRERCADTKAEFAARRMDRMEREQHDADNAEHEANLQEALTNESKAVKVLVDKWFVDKGYGFGKAPTGEVVIIHAGAVQSAEVLTIVTYAGAGGERLLSSPGEVSS